MNENHVLCKGKIFFFTKVKIQRSHFKNLQLITEDSKFEFEEEKWFGCLKPTPKIRPKDVIGWFENLIGGKWWKRKSELHLSKN